MKLRVLHGTPGDGRHDAVIAMLLERVTARRSDSVAMITASEVTRRRLLDRVTLTGGVRGLFDAPIHTLVSFVERLHLTRPVPGTRLTPAEKEVVLGALLRRSTPGLARPFTVTPGTVRAAAQFIARLKRIGVYRSEQARAHVPAFANPSPLLEILLELFDRYQQVLEERGLYDDEGIFIEATDPHRRDALRLDAVVPKPELLLVAPLQRTAVIERAVLARLFELFQMSVVALDSWEGGPQPLGGAYLAAERSWLSSCGATFEAPAAIEPRRAELLAQGHANRPREIEAIACAIASQPAPEQTAIVVLDEARYLPLIEEILPRHGLAIHAVRGMPLTHNPMFAPVAHLLDVLQFGLVFERVEALFTNQRVQVRIGEQVLNRAADLFALLRRARIPPTEACPLAAWHERVERLQANLADELARTPERERAGRAPTLALLHEQGGLLLRFLAQLPEPASEWSATEVVGIIEVLIATCGLEQALPSDHGDHARAALERLGVGLSTLLDTLRSYCRASTAASAGAQPMREHASVLRSLLERGRYRPRRARQAVTVISARDVTAARFTHVYVPGLTDDAFPVAAERDLFLSEADAAALEIKTTQDRLREAHHQLATLVGETSGRVVLTYPRRDAMRELLPSSVIVAHALNSPPAVAAERLPLSVALVRMGARWRLTGEGSGLADQLSRALSMPITTLLRGAVAEESRLGAELGAFDGLLFAAARTDAAQQVLGGRPFSPRAFEVFGSCPMKFLFTQLLGIESVRDVEPDLTPIDRGNLVHQILQQFYAGEDGARMAALKGSAEFMNAARERLLTLTRGAIAAQPHHGVFRARAEADLTRGLAAAEPHRGVLASFLAIESGDLARTMPKWLEASFGLAPRGDEPSLQHEPARVVLDGDGREFAILVRGRIDRVDVDRDGRHILFDYKTGQERTRPRYRELGINFQLPLYYLAMQAVAPQSLVLGACHVDLHAGRVVPAVGDRSALVAAGLRVPANDELSAALALYRARLVELCDTVEQGRFHTTRLDLKGEPCKLCDFRRSCRGANDRQRIALLAATGQAFPRPREGETGGDDD